VKNIRAEIVVVQAEDPRRDPYPRELRSWLFDSSTGATGTLQAEVTPLGGVNDDGVTLVNLKATLRHVAWVDRGSDDCDCMASDGGRRSNSHARSTFTAPFVLLDRYRTSDRLYHHVSRAEI
jgi:hypothetical protein